MDGLSCRVIIVVLMRWLAVGVSYAFCFHPLFVSCGRRTIIAIWFVRSLFLVCCVCCVGLQLQHLSLVGNPITKEPNYRLYVIHKLPQLRVFDFQKVKPKVSAMF